MRSGSFFLKKYARVYDMASFSVPGENKCPEPIGTPGIFHIRLISRLLKMPCRRFIVFQTIMVHLYSLEAISSPSLV